MLDTKDGVRQFLNLWTKNELELRAICEASNLKTKGNKGILIQRLAALEITPQSNVTVAQAIPLRSRDNDSNLLPGAVEAIKEWRRVIFESKNNRKEFQLLNNDGKPYTVNLKYARCSVTTVKHIVDKKWLLPMQRYRDLIELLKVNTNLFVANIIQKPDRRGKSWLMLHICPKTP